MKKQGQARKRADRSKPSNDLPRNENDADTSQQVAIRAYELYLTRGCEDGHDVEDWLKAEVLIRDGTIR
ncbi:hypothetical protein W02_33000 [Nitrospira sp. KM1]|uniref:DUF2934 domain-containing protein n=1 Tax=Nitrospira sp. KM1 TaxID=1936990 RepID=UPI0013A73E3B|nr:DUF2934 domain-containing protein [Nitrospira sp. KM1]BCA56160.1 hypothetical protein W02_33000 [Nitrospira sp. KM1]